MNGTKGIVAVTLALCMSAPVQAEIFTNDRGERVECHDEPVTTTTRKGVNPTVGAIGGAVAGGVIGHQFGGGRGKDAMTAAGAVGGAMAGKHMAEKSGEQQTAMQRVCRPLPG